MEHEDVVGEDERETPKNATLGQVDLLTVTGRERRVEAADELQG